MKIALFGLAGSVITTSACWSGDCAGLPMSRLSPGDTTIAVGTSFTARYEEGGRCEGQTPAEAHYSPSAVTWRSLDSLVARVDSATGKVTALTMGDARITSDEVSFTLTVHVR
jgi:hypothetical protein